jgi:hypothetical protein
MPRLTAPSLLVPLQAASFPMLLMVADPMLQEAGGIVYNNENREILLLRIRPRYS